MTVDDLIAEELAKFDSKEPVDEPLRVKVDGEGSLVDIKGGRRDPTHPPPAPRDRDAAAA